MHGEVFSLAEKEFFKHRVNPKIGDRDVKTAITLLAEQKAANCPCLVHTDQRDYEWIVFRRQPDRIPYEDEEDVTPMKCQMMKTFSAEAEETMPTPTSDERTQVDQDIQEEIIRAASKTTIVDFSSADISDGYKTTTKPQMSESLCEPFLHSRDKSQSKSTTQKESDQKKKKMTVNLMTPLWILRLTPKKMKAEYYWALLRRTVEVSGYTALVQQAKSLHSSISNHIHMTLGCF